MTVYRSLIEKAAAMHRLDPNLVEAVVLCESSGHTDAFRYESGFWTLYLKDNPKWAGQIPRRISSSYGLMQVIAVVAYELGFVGEPEELFIPEVGLEYGCKKLRAELDWARGDVTKALGAYNAGRGNWNGAPGRAYAARVLTALKGLP